MRVHVRGLCAGPYAISYDCLGDRQAFHAEVRMGGWPSILVFYVLPFINRHHVPPDEEVQSRFFLRKFGMLGPINRQVAEEENFPERLLSLEKKSQPCLADFSSAPAS